MASEAPRGQLPELLRSVKLPVHLTPGEFL
jgi:hypothetical protein